MKRLVLLTLLCLAGCAKAPTPPVPSAPIVYPISITPGLVGKRVLIQIAPAPKHFNVTCCLPPGMSIESSNGALWLSGTPRQAGRFSFRITP